MEMCMEEHTPGLKLPHKTEKCVATVPHHRGLGLGAHAHGVVHTHNGPRGLKNQSINKWGK